MVNNNFEGLLNLSVIGVIILILLFALFILLMIALIRWTFFVPNSLENISDEIKVLTRLKEEEIRNQEKILRELEELNDRSKSDRN